MSETSSAASSSIVRTEFISKTRAPLTGTVVMVPQHGYLARATEACDHLHLLIDGWAARYRILNDGRRQITRLYVPGNLCDLTWLGQPVAGQHVAAVLPVKTARVPMVQAQETMARDPSVNKLFWNELRQMIDSQAEWAVNLGRKTAIERIAYLFCEMTERIGRVATGGPSTCEMPLTQVDIADSTGLTPVHVNRVLQEMRAAKFIELHSRRLKIFDFEQLARLAFYQKRLTDPGRALRFRSIIDIAPRGVAAIAGD